MKKSQTHPPTPTHHCTWNWWVSSAAGIDLSFLILMLYCSYVRCYRWEKYFSQLPGNYNHFNIKIKKCNTKLFKEIRFYIHYMHFMGIRKRCLGGNDSEKWLENPVLKGPNQKAWAKQERLLCEGACNETTGRCGSRDDVCRSLPPLHAFPAILILEQQSPTYAWLLSRLVVSWPLAYAGGLACSARAITSSETPPHVWRNRQTQPC